jgi:DNA-binding protein HU-beta
MNKQDFLRLLAEKAGSSIVEADKWFKVVIETIGDAVQRTDDLRFIGFGSFKSKIKKALDVKTPIGTMVHVPAKRVVTFSVGTELKQKALTKVDFPAGNDKKADVKKPSTKGTQPIKAAKSSKSKK